MTIKLDLIWREDGATEFRAGCAACSYRSGPFDDEDTARASWFGHVCVGPATPANA